MALRHADDPGQNRTHRDPKIQIAHHVVEPVGREVATGTRKRSEKRDL